MLGRRWIESQTTANSTASMDRHVEFTTQLSHLVALYTRDPVDDTAERATLRAARGAAKYGAITLSVEGGRLRAGPADAPTDVPEVAALQLLLSALGIVRIAVPHHANPEEVRYLAQQLGAVAAGRMTPQGFTEVIASHEWNELVIDRAAVVVEEAPSADTMEPTPVLAERDGAPIEVPLPAEPAPQVAAESPASVAEHDAPSEPAAEVPGVPAEPAAPPPPATPLADQLPDSIADLAGPAYRELFARLVTSSEPQTLRRLLEPVMSSIELAAREGRILESLGVLLAMFACEALAQDDEMRRQFFVALRRLTKPTLIRAYAMLYFDAGDDAPAIEQALARFGEDGAEAVADCIGSATNHEVRERYLGLLRRLPGTPDALLMMLDDDRVSVVERAIELVVAVQHADSERVLGDALSHNNMRVRLAAARALATVTGSAFAADALLRAAQDPSPEVRLTGAVGLQSRREERLAASIVPLVDTEEELDVQLALVTVLGKLASPDAVQRLVVLANPTERMMRRRRMPVLRLAAIEALGEARTPPAMAALQKLLEDKEKDVREAAARLYTRARRQTAAMNAAALTDS